ncbi:predicted protein [Naegleria gruberi]|uniref:Predicted protein n=1 Tax=Naegleria gruberi TaxID=5762 RepID=D2VKG4_NAEGR|nr:uncharacterized protein NAEGRDRAFT_69384 [Naegleria gruberi]EFC42591.1 predicted protein [Naegleria gruberi]|eukprot:XP_002675335.1 predicted protein [Naegleria gruberi strain NEG-M]
MQRKSSNLFHVVVGRIGKPLPILAENSYDRSITLLSNNAYNIRTEFQKIDYNPYVVIFLSPPTPEGETTRISFRLTYSVSYISNKPFYKYYYGDGDNRTKYEISYYYKDNSPIGKLTSTFIFSSSITFTVNPNAYNGETINPTTIRFTETNLTTASSPTVHFLPSDTRFDKCSRILDMRQKPETSTIIVAVVLPVCACLMIALFVTMF